MENLGQMVGEFWSYGFVGVVFTYVSCWLMGQIIDVIRRHFG